MTYTYDINTNGKLVIRASEEERASLAELKADADARLNRSMMDLEAEALESLIANSELEWIDPAETGDLTDAPMLGIRDSDTENGPTCEGKVIARWAYMDYQVRSFVDDLIERGEAIFVS